MVDRRDTPQSYPPAHRQELVELLHDRPVTDPYRWLEDADDEATVEWSSAQDRLTRTCLDELPGRAWLSGRLGNLLGAGSVSAPLWRAGRRFHMRREPGQEHSVLYVTEADGTERVLLDPGKLDPTGLTTLDSWLPDLEGRQLAYRVSRGGDEASMLHVLDVANGEQVQPPIDRCRHSSIAWLPGGERFLYVRLVAPHEAPDGKQAMHRRIWLHRVGDNTSTDRRVEGPGLYEEHNYYGVQVSRDGRWLTVSGSVGTAPRDSIWLGELGDDAAVGPLSPLLTQSDDVRAHLWVERDGRLYVLTTDGAPRGRLMVADPTAPAREHWRELVAEDQESVLEAVRWLQPTGTVDGGLLVLARSRHAVAELALHRAVDGTPVSAVPLPGTGSLTGLSVADRDTTAQHGKLWIGWTDLITPPEVHRFDLSEGTTVMEKPAPGHVQVPAALTEQREFRSADGTTVRMFVVSPAGRTEQGPRPALLTGYGGFGVSREPSFSASALAWVAAGGVYALASLRGGGEEGESWHRGGMRESKQRVFDDFHAAADALVSSGLTSNDRLAILGGSNGGLLVGAALTQRPDSYRAVVCSAPLLDMVRYEKFSLGPTWNDEYGTAELPEELDWLLSYSPYHHVEPGTTYPAVLFTVFESDSRVDPAHARKMCAALQHTGSGDPRTRPVLLRRETDVGHSTRSVSRALSLGVDQLAFLAAHTGLELL